ncbi:MAG: nuclear transport factor 2 family protein [Pseudomonadota bacterium]
MPGLKSEVDELYARYLEAWNARDFEGVAACYTEPAMFVLPTGAVSLPDRPALVALLKKLFAGLEADGFSHSTIGAVGARACGEGLAIADARDVRRLRADGSTIEVIDGHYVLRKDEGSWLFMLVVTCTPGWQEG